MITIVFMAAVVFPISSIAQTIKVEQKFLQQYKIVLQDLLAAQDTSMLYVVYLDDTQENVDEDMGNQCWHTLIIDVIC